MRAKNSKIISQVKEELTAVFKIVDIRSISFYFGPKVNQNYKKKMNKLSHLTYINKILVNFPLFQANTLNIPIKKTLLEPSKKS